MKMKWNLQNKIIAGSLLPIVMAIILGHQTFSNISRMEEMAAWVDHTNLVLVRITMAEKLIIDLETGERGFLLTGKEKFLRPLQEGKILLKEVFVELRKLISDNPSQVGRLAEIEMLVHKWDTIAAKPEIKLREEVSNGNNAILNFNKIQNSTLGKELFDVIREVLHGIDSKLQVRKNTKHQFDLPVISGQLIKPHSFSQSLLD